MLEGPSKAQGEEQFSDTVSELVEEGQARSALHIEDTESLLRFMEDSGMLAGFMGAGEGVCPSEEDVLPEFSRDFEDYPSPLLGLVISSIKIDNVVHLNRSSFFIPKEAMFAYEETQACLKDLSIEELNHYSQQGFHEFPLSSSQRMTLLSILIRFCKEHSLFSDLIVVFEDFYEEECAQHSRDHLIEKIHRASSSDTIQVERGALLGLFLSPISFLLEHPALLDNKAGRERFHQRVEDLLECSELSAEDKKIFMEKMLNCSRYQQIYYDVYQADLVDLLAQYRQKPGPLVFHRLQHKMQSILSDLMLRPVSKSALLVYISAQRNVLNLINYKSLIESMVQNVQALHDILIKTQHRYFIDDLLREARDIEAAISSSSADRSSTEADEHGPVASHTSSPSRRSALTLESLLKEEAYLDKEEVPAAKRRRIAGPEL